MKVLLTHYICDAPGCNQESIGSKEDPPLGLVGTVAEHGGGGGITGVEWFACTSEHVGPAVAAAIRNEWEKA